MPTYASCIAFFSIIYTILLALNRFYVISMTSIFFLLVFVSIVFIMRYAPVESVHKKLTKHEKKLLSHKTRILTLLDMALFVICYLLAFMQIAKFIGFALILIAALMAAGLLQRRALSELS